MRRKKLPQPWFRPSRGLWYVTLDGKQHNLGPDETAAFTEYERLLRAPKRPTRQRGNYDKDRTHWKASGSPIRSMERVPTATGIDPSNVLDDVR